MKLQLYILRQLLVACAFSVGGLMAIALPGIAVSTVHKIPNADLSVLLQLLPLTLQTLVPYVLPMCFLLACVATYGRLAADREWTAIQMAGIWPLRMMLPCFAVALLFGLGTYWMVATQLPQMKDRLRALKVQAVTSSIGNLGAGRTALRLGDVLVEALWHDPETDLLHEVYVREPGHGGRPDRDYHAKTARLSMSEGVLTVEMTDLLAVDPRDGRKENFEWVEFDYPLQDEGVQRSQRPKYYSSGEIRERLRRGEIPPNLIDRSRFELHYRYVLSSAYLLFTLLGVSTGLVLRKGTQLGALAVSSGYGLLYYLLNMRLGKQIGQSGLIDPVFAAWVPTSIGLVIALFFTWKALKR